MDERHDQSHRFLANPEASAPGGASVLTPRKCTTLGRAARRVFVHFSLALCAFATASAQLPPGAQFVASTRGHVFYSVHCDAWKRLSKANLRYFDSKESATRAGYEPSKARGCGAPTGGTSVQAFIGGEAKCVVTRIVDGDTFDCGSDRIRMLLVDADESRQSIFADSATRLLTKLIPPGTTVRLTFDVEVTDRYKRLLAYVYAGPLFINRELARNGLAHVLVYPPNVRHVEAIRAAVDSARADRRGEWASSAFTCAPVDYRAGRCR
jgi:micrococcal nuclease